MRWLIVVSLMINAVSAAGAEKFCTYSTYKWNTLQKSAVEFEEVRKRYSDLAAEEIDRQTGCSVCREDQVSILVAGRHRLRVCKYIAPQIESALAAATDAGQEIDGIKGYRAGKTKGEVDSEGNRTQYSNHSFGTAIDVNPENNGLYENCLTYGAHCILRKGGEWMEGHRLSLDAQSPIVIEMKRRGFKWGGEIPGKQKDFMHFSLSGY
ncbi:MAG: M15 family metallopeptidase [Gammaproteobacteria bacterium]|nr:M15 family metallopeptidase [Gammaproteobacteria bacterium]